MAFASRRPILLCWLLALLVGSCEGRTVQIDVRAPWPVFPSAPLVETAEFLSDYGAEAFWDFTSSLCSESVSSRIDALLHTSNAERADLQTLAYESATGVLPSSLHAIMDTTIGLGSYAPAVQFSHSLLAAIGGSPCPESSSAFALVYPGGQSVCSVDEYLALRGKGFVADCISNNEPEKCREEEEDQQNESWDHVYPSSFRREAAGRKHVVLYGTLGSSSFCQMHKAVVEDATRDESVMYTARHAFLRQTPLANETVLPGYGVFLDIKNMEYNTANDNKDKKQEEGEGDEQLASDAAGKKDALAGIADGVDISGVYFSQLLKRRPGDREELGILKEELEKAEREKMGKQGGQMKVWKIKDLGVQTVQAIVSAPSPLDRFAEYAHSFPSHATELSSTKLKATFVESINTWLSAGMGQFIPHNCLVVNGVRVDLGGSTFSVFDLLSVLKGEFLQRSKLQSLGLSAALQGKLLRAASAVSGGSSGSSGSSGGGGGGGDMTEGVIRIDVSKGSKHVVTFINNLEKDAQYKRWPKSMRQMLMPSWSLHSIARNLYTLIFVIDPWSFEGVNLLMQVQSMHAQQYPIRFGVVLRCDDGVDGAAGEGGKGAQPPRRSEVCQLFAKAKEAYGVEKGFAFLMELASHVSEALQGLAVDPETGGLDLSRTPFPALSSADLVDVYASAMAAALRAKKAASAAEAKEVLASAEWLAFATNSTKYVSDRGLRFNSFSLNGVVRDGDDISNSLMQILGREQYIIANYYRKKQVTDKTTSIFSAILGLSGAFSRYHPLLEDETVTYSDALMSNPHSKRYLDSAVFLDAPGCAASASASAPASAARNTTVFVAPMSRRGLQSAAAAARWLASVDQLCTHRLALEFYAPSPELSACIASASCSAASDPDTLDVLSVVSLVSALGKEVPLVGAALSAGSAAAALAAVEALDAGAAGRARGESGPALFKSLEAVQRRSSLAMSAVEWSPSAPGAQEVFVGFNARKLVLSEAGEPLHELDLDLLAGHEHSRVGRFLAPLVASEQALPSSSSSSPAGSASDLLVRMSSFVGQYSANSRRYDVHSVLDQAGFSSSSSSSGEEEEEEGESNDSFEPSASAPFIFRVPASAAATSASTPGSAASLLSVYCIVDPLSLAGQRAASVIKLLAHHLQLAVTVILVPKTEYTEFPLQNFYRQVLVPHAHEQSARAALFANLPHQHTLTVRPDAPEPWNIQAAVAEEDTDNLRCGAGVGGGAGTGAGAAAGCGLASTAVTYTLKNVLVAGQCFQTASAGGGAQQPAPPKGLQLTLSAFDVASGTAAPTPEADTLVMQNLGYFQLLANPGLWKLDVVGGNFTILPGSGSGSGQVQAQENAVAAPTRLVALRAFTGQVNRVMVSRNTPDESRQLKAKASKSSIWGSLFGSSGSGGVTASGANETIHVFSLATGHMYERLLRIMMLSVVKRTSVKVKFWLFENYLSPTFKNVAAAMAAEYGFEVAYVTYKWPEWLTQQTEKQRIIWGYKILFLDVLFPLDVKRIIYVDADQVVRADLKELWDLDLKGKPYGYTPFCSSREETLGFQFWRSGYWAEHLRGKPYHISALYVVDLQRFREFSVGDQLRAVYDGLARDPNSLANLDQDLPNYAQHSVPIHSLPQEWLWCETWCSDKTKEKAKTIDLCNNPLHKEPKLDMARRVINGHLFNESWVELDTEITELRKRRGFVFSD